MLVDIFNGVCLKCGLLARRGCPGAITFSGYSARAGKVEGALCDNPIYCYPEPGEAGSEIATVVREGSQATEEHGESSNPSGEQDS